MATSTSAGAVRPSVLFTAAGALVALAAFAIAGYTALAVLRAPGGPDTHGRLSLVANLLVSGCAALLGVLIVLKRVRPAALVFGLGLAALAWNLALRSPP